jgi:hypothetical protein
MDQAWPAFAKQQLHLRLLDSGCFKIKENDFSQLVLRLIVIVCDSTDVTHL